MPILTPLPETDKSLEVLVEETGVDRLYPSEDTFPGAETFPGEMPLGFTQGETTMAMTPMSES